MEEAFKIYIDQLKDGQSEEIKEKLSPDFLDVNEKDLSFNHPVEIEGEVYLAGADMIMRLDVETIATIPCAICNEPVDVAINLNNFYHTTPLVEIKSGIYNFKEMLRENILLIIPQFAECNGGECPEREQLKEYLRSEDKDSEDEGYKPFAHL